MPVIEVFRRTFELHTALRGLSDPEARRRRGRLRSWQTGGVGLFRHLVFSAAWVPYLGSDFSGPKIEYSFPIAQLRVLAY